jgi:ABC-2 type transport system ATP-binding protein
LLGPNGAGKTTTVRILTTLISPDAGWARVVGYDVVDEAARVRTAVGLAGQHATADPLLTGRENLDLIATLHHLSRRETRSRVQELLERFDLAGVASRRASTYSGGMRRRLDLAASLIGQPRLLVLDEPTAGLDPAGRQALWATVESLVEQGTTVLLTTQYLEEADQLADSIVVIDHGQVVATGTPDQLKAQVGGHRIELEFVDVTDTAAAIRALDHVASSPPLTDRHTGWLVVPIPGGAAPIAAVIRGLDAAGIEVADLVVRRPTLDDVFLALTGAAPTTEQADPAAVTVEEAS